MNNRPPFCSWRTAIQLCIFMVGLGAASARATNLVDILRLGLENDARFASAQAAYRAGQEKETQGNAQLLPQLSLSGDYTSSLGDIVYHGNSPFTSGDRLYDTATYGINLTQPLYRRQNYAAYQQSVTQVTLAGEQMNLARVDLLTRIATGYFEQLSAQDSLDQSVAEVAALSEQLEQIQAQFHAGVASVTDVYDTKAKHDLARSREVAAKNDLLSKQQALRRITSVVKTDLAAIRPGVTLPSPIPDNVDEWVSKAREYNAQIRTQQGNRKVAQWDIERAKGAHYPSLDLVASYTRNRSSGSVYTEASSSIDTMNAGVRLQVPIFTGGDASSRVREATANLEKVSQDLEDTQRDIENQCRVIFLALINGRSQITALEQALESNDKFLDAIRLGRQAGLRTTTDVLNAQQQLFSIKRDLSKARYEYLLNLLKLRGLVGALGEKDFEEVNGLLQ